MYWGYAAPLDEKRPYYDEAKALKVRQAYRRLDVVPNPPPFVNWALT